MSTNWEHELRKELKENAVEVEEQKSNTYRMATGGLLVLLVVFILVGIEIGKNIAGVR